MAGLNIFCEASGVANLIDYANAHHQNLALVLKAADAICFQLPKYHVYPTTFVILGYTHLFSISNIVKLGIKNLYQGIFSGPTLVN